MLQRFFLLREICSTITHVYFGSRATCRHRVRDLLICDCQARRPDWFPLDPHTYSYPDCCGCTLWAYGGSQGVKAYVLGPYTYVQLTYDHVILSVGFSSDSDSQTMFRFTNQAYGGPVGLQAQIIGLCTCVQHKILVGDDCGMGLLYLHQLVSLFIIQVGLVIIVHHFGWFSYHYSSFGLVQLAQFIILVRSVVV